jgi:hypothetical protein
VEAIFPQSISVSEITRHVSGGVQNSGEKFRKNAVNKLHVIQKIFIPHPRSV